MGVPVVKGVSSVPVLFIQYKYSCPSEAGYTRMSGATSATPLTECDQAATYLGLDFERVYTNGSAVYGDGSASGNTGCFMFKGNRTVYYVEPVTVSSALPAADDVILICKNTGVVTTLPPTPSCDCATAVGVVETACAESSNNGVILLSVCTLLYMVLVLPVVVYFLLKKFHPSDEGAKTHNDRDSISNLESAVNSPLSTNPNDSIAISREGGQAGAVRFAGRQSVVGADHQFPRLLPQTLPAPSSCSNSSFAQNYTDLPKKIVKNKP